MGYLLLSVLFSSCLPLLLKGFASWRVNVFLAVSTNYLVCVVVGSFFGQGGALSWPWQPPIWIVPAVVQGAILAGNFYLLAFAAQRSGVAIAALSSRLSVAIPVILAIPIYGDRLTLINGMGVLGALAALVLSSTMRPMAHPLHRHRSAAWLPSIIFFTFGLHFFWLKYVQHFFLTPDQHHDYLTVAFLFALLTSLGILMVMRRSAGTTGWGRGFLGGVLLGACNYGALFCLTRVLSLDGWQSAIVFPTYSVGVVVVSSLGAVVLFAERISRRRLAGIAVGLVSVVMLNV